MKLCSQEVAQIGEAVPATTCRKTRNVNMNNLSRKNNEEKHKNTAKNKASTQIHI